MGEPCEEEEEQRGGRRHAYGASSAERQRPRPRAAPSKSPFTSPSPSPSPPPSPLRVFVDDQIELSPPRIGMDFQLQLDCGVGGGPLSPLANIGKSSASFGPSILHQQGPRKGSSSL